MIATSDIMEGIEIPPEFLDTRVCMRALVRMHVFALYQITLPVGGSACRALELPGATASSDRYPFVTSCVRLWVLVSTNRRDLRPFRQTRTPSSVFTL